MTETQTTPLLDRPIMFLDLETTGLDWRAGHEIWEYASVRLNPGSLNPITSLFEIEVDESRMHPMAAEVSGYHRRRGSSAIHTREVAARRIQQLTAGAVIIGAVPDFDTGHMANLLAQFDLQPKWHYQLVDVETLAAGWLARNGRPVVPPWDSDEIATRVGVAPASLAARHTALGDVLWAARIYYAVQNRGACPTWAHEAAFPGAWPVETAAPPVVVDADAEPGLFTEPARAAQRNGEGTL